MTQLTFVHISEDGFFADDKKLNIIGIFDQLWTEGFPAVHPRFAVITGMTGDIGTYEQWIEIFKPTGELLIKSTVSKISLTFNGQVGHCISKFLNIAFPDEGVYRFTVKIDGTQVGESILKVNKLNAQRV